MISLDAILLARADEQCRGSRLPPDGRDPWDIGPARRKPGPKPTLRRFTEGQIRRIRQAREDGESFGSIAQAHGTSKGVIQAIVARRTYREVA